MTPTTPAVILDTNAVLDWLVFNDGGMTALATAISTQKIQWIASQTMWDELERVLTYPALSARNPDLGRVQTHWRQYVKTIEPPLNAAPLLCKDVDDQKFLDLAFACKATWLISKDKALLTLKKKAAVHGITITRPEQWIGL